MPLYNDQYRPQNPRQGTQSGSPRIGLMEPAGGWGGGGGRGSPWGQQRPTLQTPQTPQGQSPQGSQRGPQGQGYQPYQGPESTTTGATFSQMQQQGYARPAPSGFDQSNTQMMPERGGPTPQSGGDSQFLPPGAGGFNPNPTPGNQDPFGLPGGTIPGGGGYTGFNPQNPWGWMPGYLANNVQNYGGFGPFNNQGQPNYQVPNAPAPTQFQGPQQSVNQPTLPGGPTGTPGVDSAAQNLVMQQLGSPSRYGTQMAQDVYGMLNNQLGQGFDVQRQYLNEEMARRGLSDSTVAVGRLGDIGIQQAQAQRDLATQVGREAAQTQAGDVNSAINNALGYGGQQFGQQLAGGQAGFGNQMSLANLQQQMGQQGFQNALSQAGFNAGQQQQGFQNQLAGQQFGLGAQQQGFQNALASYGANQGTNAQNFGQQQQWLNQLLGYGQNQFQNQLQTSQFNAAQDMANQSLWLQLLGLT